MPFNKYDSLVEVQVFFLRVGDYINYDALEDEYTWYKSLDETCAPVVATNEKLSYDTDVMIENNMGLKFKAVGEGIDIGISCGLDYELQEDGASETLGRCFTLFKEIAERKVAEYKNKATESLEAIMNDLEHTQEPRTIRFITVWTYRATEQGTSYELVGILRMDETLEMAMERIPPIKF
jgi:hypothetical protein